MRDWELTVSMFVFSTAGLVVFYTVIQIVLAPFQIGSSLTPATRADFSAIQLPRLEPIELYQKQFSVHSLFYRPHEPKTVPTPSIFEQLDHYVLTGIIQGEQPEALIQNKLTKQMHFVQEKEQFDQFTLIQLKSHSAIVEYQGQQKEISIEEGSL